VGQIIPNFNGKIRWSSFASNVRVIGTSWVSNRSAILKDGVGNQMGLSSIVESESMSSVPPSSITSITGGMGCSSNVTARKVGREMACSAIDKHLIDPDSTKYIG